MRLGGLSLRAKMLSLIVLVAVGLVTATLVVVQVITERETAATLRSDLERTRVLFETYQALRLKEIASENRLIGEVPFLKALISTGDEPTLRSFARDLQQRIASDLLLITDNQGRLLGSTDGGIPEDLARRHPSVGSALQGRAAAGILVHDNRLYQVYAAPIGLGQSIYGTMTIGFRLDDRLAADIKKMTQSEVTFVADGAVVASTWSGEPRRRLEASARQLLEAAGPAAGERAPGAPFDLDLGAGPHLSLLVPFAVEGSIRGAYLIQRSRAEVARVLGRIRNTVFAVGFLVLLGAAGISYLVTEQILDPIASIVESSRVMARGDLTASVPVEHRDETGALARAFNDMAHDLRGLISQVRENTMAVADAARTLHETSDSMSRETGRQESAILATSSSITRMTSAVQNVSRDVEALSASADDASSSIFSSILDLNAGVEEIAANTGNLSGAIEATSSSVAEMTASLTAIAASVESLHGITAQTASALHELSASVQQVEQNAQRSQALSEQSTRDARRGMQAVHETIASIREIETAFATLQEIVSRLAEKSGSIGTIVGVITEIAEQTDLLSLNAAIIAAQTGANGRGFAVVADEIKSLAERTVASTGEIADLIKHVQDETANAVGAMQRGSERVGRGVALSNEAGELLKVIIESSEASAGVVSEIVKATREQAGGIRDVDRAMSEVEQMVERINRATQEQSRASGEVTRAVENMRALGQEAKRYAEEQSRGRAAISTDVEKIIGMVRNIVKATHEQGDGSRQIADALQVFEEATRASVQRAEQMKSIVAALAQRSERLDQEVGRFRT